MYVVDKMIKDMYKAYERTLKEYTYNQALLFLWDEFYDKNPDEESVVLNIILAKLNLDKGPIDITAKCSIKEALLNYEKFKTKLRLCYSAEDNQIIDDIVAEIVSKQDIWKM